MSKQPIGVLFICLGNICRSPMAEAVFRKLVEQKGLTEQFLIDSAGTGDWHIGSRPHVGTQEVLMQHGISPAGMFARQVRSGDFHEFKYLICMDGSNVKNTKGFANGSHQATIGRLLEWIPDFQGDLDVPDPYYDGRFEDVYELVLKGCHHLLEWIIAEENIPESNG